MVNSNLPLWFKLISYQKENGIIENGLTIPYIIGSYQICNQTFVDRPIMQLFIEIIESNLEKCAVLQNCPYIRQYVIGIEDRKFCEQYLAKEIKFKNAKGQSSFFITQNAYELGGNRDKIVEQFENLFNDYISNQVFSWNNVTKNWETFKEQDIKLIKKVN